MHYSNSLNWKSELNCVILQLSCQIGGNTCYGMLSNQFFTLFRFTHWRTWQFTNSRQKMINWTDLTSQWTLCKCSICSLPLLRQSGNVTVQSAH